MRRNRDPLLVAFAVAVPLLVVLGIWLGGHPDSLPSPIRSALVDEGDTAVYRQATDLIEQSYYRKISDDDLLNASLSGAVKSLDDRFSNYFSPQEYRQFQQTTNGRFSGVGLGVLEVKKGLEVSKVYDKSPASRAGFKDGDVITAVDGRSIESVPSKTAIARIKGKEGTAVKLTVLPRGKKPKEVRRVKRASIEVPVVAREAVRAGGARSSHIALASFTAGAHGEVQQAVQRAEKAGAKGIVLDLRGNGGGLLNEAVLVSSVFIGDGTIVSIRGRDQPRRVFDATGDAIAPKIPLVVLVDKGSASASEIVTGALQDRDRATIVGTRTFGKGVFQTIRPLSNGGALDITVGQFFTPDGRNFGGKGVAQGEGLRPDVKASDDPDSERDEALQTALKVLGRKIG